MTLTRWKLMAGVLGLSMCGLAALAEPACRTVGYTHRAEPDEKPLPPPEAGGKPTPPPVDVPPPTPAALPVVLNEPPPPAIPPASPTPPSTLPALPPVGEPKEVAGGLDEKAFVDMAKSQLKLPPLPTLDQPAASPPLTAAEPNPLPKSELPKADPPALPPPPPFAAAEEPKPAGLPPAGKSESPPPPPPAAEVPAAVLTEPTPTPPIPVSATMAVERKLKVQLHLGSGKPWFEVRDGEELVLKVVSDAIEVKAPAENGDAASLLKASGAVSFRTLGGIGRCDQLQVVPGTGEVVVSGNVAVTSNWGKAETTASAEKMTFRLGGTVGGLPK